MASHPDSTRSTHAVTGYRCYRSRRLVPRDCIGARPSDVKCEAADRAGLSRKARGEAFRIGHGPTLDALRRNFGCLKTAPYAARANDPVALCVRRGRSHRAPSVVVLA